ncbi:MAG TPA: flagellar biosynthesis protein FlhB [Firmicutes bacterium]|nr:flagellar biosynthesis protein FlhB [Bacillota bacterium]
MVHFKLDLQLFAGEKTEPATPRRREEARKKGQVAKSGEVATAALVLFGFLILHLLASFMAGQLKETVQYFLQAMPEWQGDLLGLKSLFLQAFLKLGITVGPILLSLLAIGFLAQVIQVGFMSSGESLLPQFSRINPVEGFKRIFSKRALMEFFKSVFKIGLVGYMVYTQIRSNLNWLPDLGLLEITQSSVLIGEAVYNLSLRVGLFLLIIAALDYWYQRREFEESIRMTKQEVKEEFKEMEGDPLVRSKIRQRQRQIASRRMMQEIPTADVIVTNPTHYAIAIRYAPEKMAAPQVVAKGMGAIAQRIKEEGEKHDITLVENPALAKALFETTEIGQEIPADLYPAVAEVLAFVYRLKKRSV